MLPSSSHRELIAALFVLVTSYVPRAKKSALLLMLLLLTVVLGLVMPSFTSTAILGAEQQAFPDYDSLAAPYDTTGLAHQDLFVGAEAHRYAGPLATHVLLYRQSAHRRMARYLAECTETLSEISEVFFSPSCLCRKYGDDGILAVSEYMAYFLGGALSSWVII